MTQVVQIEELPLLVNGKVDRQKLLQLYLDQRQLQRGYLIVDLFVFDLIILNVAA